MALKTIWKESTVLKWLRVINSRTEITEKVLMQTVMLYNWFHNTKLETCKYKMGLCPWLMERPQCFHSQELDRFISVWNSSARDAAKRWMLTAHLKPYRFLCLSREGEGCRDSLWVAFSRWEGEEIGAQRYNGSDCPIHFASGRRKGVLQQRGVWGLRWPSSLGWDAHWNIIYRLNM